MARYRGYAQVCPLAKAAELLCERWTMLVVRELLFGSQRYSDLRRGIPMVSPTMLSQRLRELEDNGVIVRLRPRGSGRKGIGSVAYELTASGRDLAPVLTQMSAWGHRWAVAELRQEDLEPSYMMWVAHKTIRADAMGVQRAVIAYELVDAPTARRCWWLVVDHGDVELCFKHPGFAIDVTVSTKLQPMALLILGRLSPKEAVRSGAVKLEGSPELRRRFPDWYPRSFEYSTTSSRAR
ncbi:MAG: transcriptional regulator [Deltaproteobacteria bacterium]|jgi:DNA-binding HxlR family transcriptional regulator|nr:transcriptional regulator [Deltaproteobacteria bacterium]